ncbi:MAG: type II toxin-antitoxin system VapC family toxin [Deltaproteobacteria bacterium]|nr:type II toxin-antitoxin system VapC family toxin [Deltaproteobacteria bacterium]MBW1816630.1 type II toxin-antitoxin system VapC family toxin [Deltaproteobacteria bacterium]MBW2284912.1 type II toxin-antitoxin system VapC family toxin [Deltaproteobacteria bacterium]
MILPDVNVLVHAFRSDSQDHKASRFWLDSVVNGDALYGMSPQVLSSLVRITTHRKVFSEPSALDEALVFCDVLLAQHNCVPILPGHRHWQIFSRLCIEADARGNLIPDAWFAALAIESGSEWITLDRDYARFPGLRWRLPW